MFRIANIEKVNSSFTALAKAAGTIVEKNGQDIVEEVKKTPREEGQPLSPDTQQGQPRQALYEAVYQAEIMPSPSNIKNADGARSEMRQDEKDGVEDAIVDRVIRDFIHDLFKGI